MRNGPATASRKLVTIPYISMHDSTRVMVERLAVKLSEQGLSIICRDLGSQPDSLTVETGHFITDLVDAAAVVMATPTLIGGPHPNMAYAAMIASAMRPKTRYFALIGSYGWATKVEETMTGLTGGLKAERLAFDPGQGSADLGGSGASGRPGCRPDEKNRRPAFIDRLIGRPQRLVPRIPAATGPASPPNKVCCCGSTGKAGGSAAFFSLVGEIRLIKGRRVFRYQSRLAGQ